ncbi:MAG: UDP-N-acetylmuramoyl-L-alanine--D-glutamate ligase [Bacteroidetes bacterium]|nr:UDP-N-acetylmuramoyl-L-alanine--D-glutamate ligase [Bacteroidota bacterium]
MNQRISILGAQESGIGAAVLAKALGMEVFVSDGGQPKPRFLEDLEHLGVPYETGSHTMPRILEADLVVISPGIPTEAPVAQAVLQKGIPLISELEFAGRHTSAPIVAITGSNGKTTTTTLTHRILRDGGLDAGLCGNIGRSFARMVAEEPHDWYVVEVSSFQLDHIVYFRPHIAVLLNIYENHLNRYGGDIRRYAASKFRIAMNQGPEDYFVYCADSPLLLEEMANHRFRSTLVPFSLTEKPDSQVYIQNHSIMIHLNKKLAVSAKKEKLPLDALKLKGNHNLHNAMAAAVVGRLVDIRKENIRQSLEEFESMEHRLEPVRTVNGVEYINDSKATNVNAVWFALESMHKPVVWIVGGVDKGNDYGMILPLVKQKVKAVVMLGKDIAKIQDAFRGAVKQMAHAEDMAAAVRMAGELANSGDAVLLSPACASFDLFESYEERGNVFRAEVEQVQQVAR